MVPLPGSPRVLGWGGLVPDTQWVRIRPSVRVLGRWSLRGPYVGAGGPSPGSQYGAGGAHMDVGVPA